MNIKSFILIIGLAIFLPIVGNADGFIKSVNSLSRDSASFQDKWITVRGFVAIDELGHEYLFGSLHEAKEKNFANSIDLVAIPGLERSMELLTDAACADIYGKFNAYGDKYLPTGYLLSSAGLMKVKRISECPSIEQPSGGN